jgi:hypothetical protein
MSSPAASSDLSLIPDHNKTGRGLVTRLSTRFMVIIRHGVEKNGKMLALNEVKQTNLRLKRTEKASCLFFTSLWIEGFRRHVFT